MTSLVDAALGVLSLVSRQAYRSTERAQRRREGKGMERQGSHGLHGPAYRVGWGAVMTLQTSLDDKHVVLQ